MWGLSLTHKLLITSLATATLLIGGSLMWNAQATPATGPMTMNYCPIEHTACWSGPYRCACRRYWGPRYYGYWGPRPYYRWRYQRHSLTAASESCPTGYRTVSFPPPQKPKATIMQSGRSGTSPRCVQTPALGPANDALAGHFFRARLDLNSPARRERLTGGRLPMNRLHAPGRSDPLILRAHSY